MSNDFLEKKCSIVFFDGVCGLCNGFVDFVLRRDTSEQFYFCSLQSDQARVRLPTDLLGMTTIVLWHDGRLFTKSDAVLRILMHLRFFSSLARLAYLIPRSLRDRAYELVANIRYRVFGKRTECRLPTPQERRRFIL